MVRPGPAVLVLPVEAGSWWTEVGDTCSFSCLSSLSHQDAGNARTVVSRRYGHVLEGWWDSGNKLPFTRRVR